MRIAEVSFPIPLDKTFHYSAEGLPLSLSSGMRVRASFGPRKLVGFVVSVFDGTPARPLKPIEAILDSGPILSEEGFDCALWMARRYGAPLGECLKSFLPAFIKGTAEKPAKSSVRVSPKTPQTPSQRGQTHPSFELTVAQARALDRLLELRKKDQFHAALIYGVPASGKTEVYRRLISEAVGRGGQALFLLPEISLTGPFFKEFSSLFDFPVSLWHSQVGAKKRRETWESLRAGTPQLIVGARSASLLPFKNLKLIVIDEEQDESFKQEGQIPYYHARDVLFYRAQKNRALLVLGSATPSLETWDKAARGIIEMVEMPDRVSLIPRPLVKTILPPSGGRVLSNELLSKIQERIFRKEQVILLAHRRGFATLILCGHCGWAAKCPACGVAKILHEDSKGGFFVRCHHCESKEPPPTRCLKCGKNVFRAVGAGTQKVVSELERVLPGAKTLRLDKDVLSEENKEEKKIYERFLAHEADILVGTKLVAKSFHFPEVTLVGVVDSDLVLSMPDFRASERAMQMLAQVAGRSGRMDKPGEVILQTLSPDHPAIAQTISGDYSRFAEDELKTRKSLRYPPYCAITRLIWEGPKKNDVREVAEAAAQNLKEALQSENHEIVGPSSCVLSMLRGLSREHLLIKSRPESLPEALSVARSLEVSRGVRLKINVDPYDLF